MLTPLQAISMLNDCVDATATLTIAINSGKGTKGLMKREKAVYAAVFAALVGRKATKVELDAITH